MGGKIPFCFVLFFFFSFFLPYLCRLTGSGLQNSSNCLGIKVKEYKVYSTWLANPEDLPVRSSWHCTSGYKVFPTLVPRGLSATGIPENEKTLGLKGHSQLWDRADLETTFASLKSVYINPKSNLPVGYI